MKTCAFFTFLVVSLAYRTRLQAASSIPFKMTHGTADAAAPYPGGASQGSASSLSRAPGALQPVRTWAGYNGATGLTTDAAPSLNFTTDFTENVIEMGRF